MKKPVRLITAFAILLLWGNSSGQIGSGRWGVVFYGGVLKLVGGNTDHSIVNTTGGIALTHTFSDYLTGEFGFDLGWVRPRDPDSHFKVLSNAPYRTYVYPVNIDLRFLLLPSRRFCPYIGPGAGLTHWLRALDRLYAGELS